MLRDQRPVVEAVDVVRVQHQDLLAVTAEDVPGLADQGVRGTAALLARYVRAARGEPGARGPVGVVVRPEVRAGRPSRCGSPSRTCRPYGRRIPRRSPSVSCT
ncbi:hypothetical protein SALBM311S_02928 [Streptomyces alboniger]